MNRNVQLFQRTLSAVGVASAICTFFTLRSPITPWLIGVSALCFLTLPFTVFLRPKGAWKSGLVLGGIVLLTYAITMPLWGRLWYREGEPEDWRVAGLFIVMGLNIALPAVRGLAFKQPAS